MFGLASYRHAVRKVMIDKLQCCIRKQPALLLRLKVRLSVTRWVALGFSWRVGRI